MPTKEKKKNLFADRLTGTMLFIVTGIMPLVVRLAYRPVPPELQSAIIMMEEYPDVFSYWKSWFLTIPVLVVIFYYVSDAITSGRLNINIKSLIKQPHVIAALVYLLMVILSGILSEYRYTALFGTYERGEGMIIQTAYISLFFIVMIYSRSMKYAMPIIYGLIFSSLIMGAIGLSQMLERDFFKTRLASILVTGYEGFIFGYVSSFFINNRIFLCKWKMVEEACRFIHAFSRITYVYWYSSQPIPGWAYWYFRRFSCNDYYLSDFSYS
jgi:hypothetical protein